MHKYAQNMHKYHEVFKNMLLPQGMTLVCLLFIYIQKYAKICKLESHMRNIQNLKYALRVVC